ncbi:MAG TPA: hypothetical protein VJ724_13310 [Tahibacter sp.]|nr:hypothetical protein [Tahibacter sp.]
MLVDASLLPGFGSPVTGNASMPAVTTPENDSVLMPLACQDSDDPAGIATWCVNPPEPVGGIDWHVAPPLAEQLQFETPGQVTAIDADTASGPALLAAAEQMTPDPAGTGAGPNA